MLDLTPYWGGVPTLCGHFENGDQIHREFDHLPQVKLSLEEGVETWLRGDR
jgi:hypothetical protein